MFMVHDNNVKDIINVNSRNTIIVSNINIINNVTVVMLITDKSNIIKSLVILILLIMLIMFPILKILSISIVALISIIITLMIISLIIFLLNDQLLSLLRWRSYLNISHNHCRSLCRRKFFYCSFFSSFYGPDIGYQIIV